MKYLILLLFLTGCATFSHGSGVLDTSTLKITCENECIVELERRIKLLEFYVEQLQKKSPKPVLKDCQDYGMGMVCSMDLANEKAQP